MLYKVTNKFYDSIVANGKYKRVYVPGLLVHADSRTFGLMVFSNFKQAISFSNQFWTFKIVEVEGIGEAKYISAIATTSYETYLDDFYNGNHNFVLKPPPGTVCYQSVKVIKKAADELTNFNI